MLVADETKPDDKRTLTRRRVLQLGGTAGVLAATATTWQAGLGPWADQDRPDRVGPAQDPPSTFATVRSTGAGQWSDPSTWGGRVPGEGDLAVVATPVELDVDARVAGVEIEANAGLVFRADTSTTLESSRNVVVRGRLGMAPASPSVVHRLVLIDVDEDRFVGGGKEVITSDVGVWVTGQGFLDTSGSAKTAWQRTAAGVGAGATTIELEEEPTGWEPGDEIVLTPTAGPDDEERWSAYDQVRVAAIRGRTIELDGLIAFDHPAVAVGAARTLTPEVLNLSRNVCIEGTPEGRSHIFVTSAVPQSIRHTSLRHMGPRQAVKDGNSGQVDEFVAGRYAVHIHLVEEGSRGSVMEGIVARDCGSHAFVTHFSHGVTWQDCVTHDTVEDPYWWDPRDKDAEVAELPSNDVNYDRCVASLVRAGSPNDFRLSGFFLGAGAGSAATRCVAVGIEGQRDSSGFFWPTTSEGVWRFDDNVAHNNRHNGTFAWQNTDLPHRITAFTGYHNGGFGIDHAGYRNRYVYEDSILYANAKGAINVKAVSKADAGLLQFINLACDGGGLSDYDVVLDRHVQPPREPTEFIDCSFRGHRVAAFGITGEGENPHLVDVLDSTFEGNEFWLSDAIPRDSVIRVSQGDRGWLTLRRADAQGTLRPEWNARVTPVEALTS